MLCVFVSSTSTSSIRSYYGLHVCEPCQRHHLGRLHNGIGKCIGKIARSTFNKCWPHISADSIFSSILLSS